MRADAEDGPPRRSGVRWQVLLLVAALVVCAVIAAAVVVRAAAPTTPPSPPVAAFIGDSYALGTGATSPQRGWAARVAKAEGWRARILALGGTGYYATSSGPGCGRPLCPAFGGELDRIRRVRPDVVVVSGGRNDTMHPDDAVAGAVARFFPALRKAAPHARIVVVSPLWDANPAPPRLAVVAAEVRAAAKGIDANYLAIGEPLLAHPDWIAGDGIHPNDRGHRAIAHAVLARIPRSNGGG